jgi:hypothetical protein
MVFKNGETVPSPRLCHAAVVHEGALYVHGGHNTVADTQLFSEVKSDLYKFIFGILSFAFFAFSFFFLFVCFCAFFL